MTPWLSVLMPVYNGGRYLRAALDSLVAQQAPGFEVIAVDDGSLDDSLAIKHKGGGNRSQDLTDDAAHLVARCVRSRTSSPRAGARISTFSFSASYPWQPASPAPPC